MKIFIVTNNNSKIFSIFNPKNKPKTPPMTPVKKMI